MEHTTELCDFSIVVEKTITDSLDGQTFIECVDEGSYFGVVPEKTGSNRFDSATLMECAVEGSNFGIIPEKAFGYGRE